MGEWGTQPEDHWGKIGMSLAESVCPQCIGTDLQFLQFVNVISWYVQYISCYPPSTEREESRPNHANVRFAETDP